ncbi:site-specific integrase [soil metagenome]
MPGQARILHPKDISTVFKVLETPRDRLIFAIGIYTGLRIGEIIRVTRDQVFTDYGGIRNTLKIKRLKKKDTVYSDIPIHQRLREHLRQYAEQQNQLEVAPSIWLFPSEDSNSGHLERAQAHVILKGAFDRVRLDGASTHSMRRTFLTSLSRAGVPLRTVQNISGHSSLSQLQTYLAVDPEDTREALQRLKY